MSETPRHESNGSGPRQQDVYKRQVLNSPEVVAEWVKSLRAQIERFLSFEGENAARMVNNLDWSGQMSALQLLRDVGKHFRVGTMVKKEIVAKRLNSDEGISYTEFSYQILQGLDFLELNRRFGCTLQTGGSDQWGNLTSGTELIRKVEGKSVHAIGTPLITNSDGTKFGKSEGNAIWPVSYTHLDVYKRQPFCCLRALLWASSSASLFLDLSLIHI